MGTGGEAPGAQLALGSRMRCQPCRPLASSLGARGAALPAWLWHPQQQQHVPMH